MEFELEHVTLRVGAFVGGGASWCRFDCSMNGDAAKQPCRIELTRDDRDLRRWRRSRSLFRDLDLDRCLGGDLGAMPALERDPAQHDRRQRRSDKDENKETKRS